MTGRPPNSKPPKSALPTELNEREDWSSTAWLWWDRLQPVRNGQPNPNADRGALARLRRASTPFDVLDEQSVFVLHQALGFGSRRAELTLIPVAIAASVLARVREHDSDRKPARVAGRDRFADTELETAALSPARLRRLLAAREPDEVHRQMRRLVDLCGPALDVGALAVLILDWFDEERGRKARTRFAYEYYAASGAPPGTPSDPAPPSA